MPSVVMTTSEHPRACPLIILGGACAQRNLALPCLVQYGAEDEAAVYAKEDEGEDEEEVR